MTKSEQIKKSLSKTKKRRQLQNCKVFTIKVDKSHLSREKISHLRRTFLETKWLYNFILSQDNIFDFDSKLKSVEVLNKDKEKECRELIALSSQMKQAIVDRTIQNIINLSKVKKKGKTVGKLKYKSVVNAVPLKQNNSTHTR